MLRPYRARAVLLASVLLAAGCQDYNFNPVGHCLIQPGTRRVTLSEVSTADVLFVVDESGSMGGEQQALADNFDAFIENLNQTNLERSSRGLAPIDFHLAVTTSSVFWNEDVSGGAIVCTDECPDATGQPVCCAGNRAARKPRPCSGEGAACPVAGTSCRLDCNLLKGEYHCCAADGTVTGALTELVPCDASRIGTTCGTLQTHYRFPRTSTGQLECATSTATEEWPYPAGDFVSSFAAGTPNPRVLHFDKSIYPNATPCAATAPECPGGQRCVGTAPGLCRKLCASAAECGEGRWRCVAGACEPTNEQGLVASELVGFFRENVQVGTCGSGEEQALQAARLALQKALAGQQRDTRDAAGGVAWSAPTATKLPGSAPARWPSPSSKIVLVFVGDEDDCSSPADPAGGVVMLNEPLDCATPGRCDACQRDALATTPAEIGKKQFRVQEFVDFFTELGRPAPGERPTKVAAGFILPASQESCTLQSCTTGTLCCHPTLGCDVTNGAQAAGHRLLEAAKGLAQNGVDVVAGSICDPRFNTLLNEIAEIVKPPAGLELPTLPAAGDVTLLRIGTASGTRKLCSRPAPAGTGTDLSSAQSAIDPQTGRPYDWWFADPSPDDPNLRNLPTGVSQFVYINPNGSCIANPGETYSADYLGQLPAGGCWDNPAYVETPGQETRGDAMCRAFLGGEIGSWTCFTQPGAAPDTCAGPMTQTNPGTCICGNRFEKNCTGDAPQP